MRRCAASAHASIGPGSERDRQLTAAKIFFLIRREHDIVPTLRQSADDGLEVPEEAEVQRAQQHLRDTTSTSGSPAAAINW